MIMAYILSIGACALFIAAYCAFDWLVSNW